jgi:hypothetical protein
MPTATDLVTDLPADFEVFGQAVDTRLKALNPQTTLGDITYASATANTNTRLGIGTAGQVLAVSGGGVPAWTTTADVTPLTTKGDLFTFTTADARIGVGANGTVLTADSAEATGLKWATPTVGMTNPMTTTGDTIYSSSGSTPARLGIGTTGQVLTVSGGVPAWATPAAGGGMTLIGSSSLSGASVTISSIPSTYKHLMILVERAYSSSSDYPMALRFNSDTGSNYNNKTLYGQTDANSYAYFRNDSVNATSMEIRTRTLSSVDAGKNLNLVLNVYNYSITDPRFLQGSAYSMNSGSEVITTQTTGTYKGSSAISSVTALIPGTNWSGGTFSVYGVS